MAAGPRGICGRFEPRARHTIRLACFQAARRCKQGEIGLGNQSRSLIERITLADTAIGRMSAWWLGGSGFVLRESSGRTLLIDPYLSNSVEPIFGLRRGFPVPLPPEEFCPDVIVSTHWHEDHLDPGTIPVIARHSPETMFVMPPSAASRAASWGVLLSRVRQLTSGESFEIAGFRIEHVPARHDAGIPGWESPDAMGLWISTAEASFYHSGDTEYDSRIRRRLSGRIDVATACVNGVTGNMNVHEAALLVWQIGAGMVIPHHHRLWEGDPSGGAATLDPHEFRRTYERLGGTGTVLIPEIGEEIKV